MEIADFVPLIEEIENLDSKALVVFDVDETLIIAKDKILRPAGEKYLYNLTASFGKSLNEDQHKELRSITMLQREIAHTDPSIPALFQKMQKKCIASIALTAMPSGKYGLIPSMEEWRGEELKRSGIDFTLHSPIQADINFEEFGEHNPLIFYKGMLCSSDHPKGLALKAFLQKTDIKPSKIIFVEDKRNNLDSVEEEIKKMAISYKGFHYVGALKFDEEVNEEVAKFQLHYLLKNKKWLSDDQVHHLMRQ